MSPGMRPSFRCRRIFKPTRSLIYAYPPSSSFSWPSNLSVHLTGLNDGTTNEVRILLHQHRGQGAIPNLTWQTPDFAYISADAGNFPVDLRH
jgi:hypothetical protein